MRVGEPGARSTRWRLLVRHRLLEGRREVLFGGWPCGESGGVAAGGEIFGIKVAVVKAQVFVGADVFELKVGESRASRAPRAPATRS